jgi:CHAT domain-containing protein/Tfp pilus assembly protein PilF
MNWLGSDVLHGVRNRYMKINLLAIATLFTTITSLNLGFAGSFPSQAGDILISLQESRKVQADRLFQQGIERYRANQFAAAVELWQQALIVYQELQDRQGEAATLGSLGAAYLLLGNSQKAIDVSQLFLHLAQKMGDRTSEAQALGNLGIAYKSRGNYVEAIKFYQQALEIMQKIGDRQGEGQVLSNLANVYEAIGEYQRAIELYKQSLTIAKETADISGEGTILGNLGAVYANLGDYSKAVEFYQQSLAISRSTQNRNGEGSNLINLGAAYNRLGDAKKAISYYEESLAIARSIGNPRLESQAWGSLGLAYERLGNYNKAIEYHQKSVAIAQSIGILREQALALNNLAHAQFDFGLLIEAEKNLRLAIEVLDALRSQLNDSDQVSIFDTQVLTYNLLQQVLVAQNRPEAALEMSEQGRSRAFVALLAKRLSSGVSSDGATSYSTNPPALAEIKNIARWQNATLVQYSIVPDDFLAQGKLRGLAAELFIWVIQPTGEVTFRRVDKTSLKAVTKELPLQELVTNSRDSIGVRGRGGIVAEPINESEPSEKLQQLYQLLIQPIADLLPENPSARVIFLPQDSLFLVPFPALIDDNKKYLIEKHTILTAPAIGVLNLTYQQRQRRRTNNHEMSIDAANILVVGNPTMPLIPPKIGERSQRLSSLPGAEREAIAIASLFNTKAVIGKDATKAFILPQMPSAKIIHLATHGVLDDFKGFGVPGAIALAPSQQDDGWLTAEEILNLQLNAELVVLSACDTGRGQITGDGVIGLSRSLILAGVESAIVSLWSVPDAPTASLMTEFYRNLQLQPDKATALRNAMLATMKQHPNPKDWAAFTLIGEAD